MVGLVKAFLIAGILSEDGALRGSKSGTPQGGILTAPTQSQTSSLSGRFGGRRGGASREAWYFSV